MLQLKGRLLSCNEAPEQNVTAYILFGLSLLLSHKIWLMVFLRGSRRRRKKLGMPGMDVLTACFHVLHEHDGVKLTEASDRM
jgi:hypothetical protein